MKSGDKRRAKMSVFGVKMVLIMHIVFSAKKKKLMVEAWCTQVFLSGIRGSGGGLAED